MTKYNVYCPKLPIIMLALQKDHDNVCQKWHFDYVCPRDQLQYVLPKMWNNIMFAAQNEQCRYV